MHVRSLHQVFLIFLSLLVLLVSLQHVQTEEQRERPAIETTKILPDEDAPINNAAATTPIFKKVKKEALAGDEQEIDANNAVGTGNLNESGQLPLNVEQVEEASTKHQRKAAAVTSANYVNAAHHQQRDPLKTPIQGMEATVVLIGGAVLVVILIATFTKQSGRPKIKDDNDPMLHTLLYTDMDYAAM